MVKKCTPCIRRAKYAQTNVDIWLKNVHLAYNVPSIPHSPLPFFASPSFGRRPAYPCAALSGIPALECARAAKGCRPCTAPRALLPKLRLDGAGFHPALGPGKRGFLENAHSHYHDPSSTSARRLRAPPCNKLLRPCSCWLRCFVRTWEKVARRSAQDRAPKVALLLPAPTCA